MSRFSWYMRLRPWTSIKVLLDVIKAKNIVTQSLDTLLDDLYSRPLAHAKNCPASRRSDCLCGFSTLKKRLQRHWNRPGGPVYGRNN